MGYSIPEFKELLVPLGSRNRTGKLMKHGRPRFITIHETSPGLQSEPGYKDVNYYIHKIMNPPQGLEFIGYHYLITERLVIRFMLDNEFTCHCGKFGNKVSVGLERVVNIETNHEIAIAYQAMVAATLMKKHDIPLRNVVPHKYWPPTRTSNFQYWTNKECPARLLAGLYGGWDGFIKRVNKYYQEERFIFEMF